jgi:predicted transport protein
LTRYNSEFSDRSFIEKRDFPSGGFKTSPLALNEGLGALDTWNEWTINARADQLILKALEVWDAPKADQKALAALATKDTEVTRTEYTYEDHKYLKIDLIKELFEALREQVLAINPAVYEEVLKFYIAFKAETNFVDIIFYASKLRLTVNIPYGDLQDPQAKAENVKDKGRWGNGEVSLEVRSLEDIPYAMFIVRQAYDRQFDGE